MAGVVGGNAVLKPKTLFSSLSGASESYSKRWKQYYEAKGENIDNFNWCKRKWARYDEPVRECRIGNPIQILIVCWRELLAEFFGTLFLVFMVCGGIVVNNLIDVGPTAAKILCTAIMYGIATTVLMYATANTSGGHLNPVISMAVWCMGDISLSKFIMFAVCQLLGGMGGAGILYGLVDYTIGAPVHYGATKVGRNVSSAYGVPYTETIGQGYGIETVTTFIIVWVVLATARENRKDNAHFGIAAPLAIGLAVVVCAILAGPLSGASFNPARSFGPAIVGQYWLYHYIYWFGPITGALLAAFCYRALFSIPGPAWAIPRINPDGSVSKGIGHNRRVNAHNANPSLSEIEEARAQARVEPTA